MTTLLRHLNPLRCGIVLLALAAMLLVPSLSGGAPASSDGLKAHFDGTDPKTPLDLFGVRFGQTASTDLTLIIRTHEPWESSLINRQLGRTLCVILRSDEQVHPIGRLCVLPSARARSGLSLRFTVLDPATGKQLGIRDLTPRVIRPNKTTMRVSFPPPLLRLKPGRYHWVARSQYSDAAACPPPDGCPDVVPNKGEAELRVTLSIDPAARRRCFGAASRDVRRPCRNSKLARAVVPTPDVAEITPNLPCTPLKQDGLIIPCEFGTPAAEARKTVALIGDSHAAHWRAALEHVSQKVGWRGVSITRAGCPLTTAKVRLDPSSRAASCTRWNRQLPRWLARNRQISTVFVVARFDAAFVAGKSRDEFEVKMNGYASAWKRLPRSVKRVIVIRDTPKSTPDTLNCVRAAIAKRKSAGKACALTRKKALKRDGAAAAAARERSKRFKTIDMTSFFCSSKQCFPVIGGALVYKDISHLTDIYASSLGPYLLRKIRALS